MIIHNQTSLRLRGRTSFYLSWTALFVVTLLLAEIGLRQALVISLLTFGLSFPLFTLLSRRSVFSLSSALFFSLTAVTVLGALLFAFTPIGRGVLPIWVLLGFVVFVITLALIRTTSTPAQRTATDQDLAGLVTAWLAIVPSVAMIRQAFDFSRSQPVWIPDDFPFFAVVAENVSIGEPGSAFFNGVDFHYHWLTYSLFGGLNRLSGVDQIHGLLAMTPALTWLMLGLAAVSVAQILTKAIAPIVVSVLAILFANSVGVNVFATSGLAQAVVSPSTLLTASWFVAVLLALHVALRRGRITWWAFLPAFIMGFSLTLGKASTAAITFLGMMAIILHGYLWPALGKRTSFRLVLRNICLTLVPFIIGTLTAVLYFIESTSTDLGYERRLFSNPSDPYLWIVTLLPVAASVFSFLVMVLPNLSSVSLWRRESLYFAAGILSVVGLLLIGVFDFGVGNEAWFLTAALAVTLPTASVIVVETLRRTTSQTRSRRLVQSAFLAVFALSTSLALLHFGDSEFLIVRPWLTPALLLVAAGLFGLLWLRCNSTLESRNPSEVLRLSVAYLFIVSVIFGISLRVDAVVNSIGSVDPAASLRSDWIREAADLAERIQDENGDSPVAVFSQSSDEATLARWIPYLLNTQAFTVSSFDEITDYFTPGDEMARRQVLVEEFVETSDRLSCRELLRAGVKFVWLTPNLDVAQDGIATSLAPDLIPISCP